MISLIPDFGLSDATLLNFCQVLTPAGAAALAVVRVCGPATSQFLQARFSRAVRLGEAVHGELRDAEGVVIDDPVVAMIDDSPTAEICLHGGPWVVQATLDLLRGDGFELADSAMSAPAPSRAAAAHGSDQPSIEQLVLNALPRATTGLALRALLSQVAAWKRFGERHQRDPLDLYFERFEAAVSAGLREELRRVDDDRALKHLLDPPCVAIAGPTNAGKSTLANLLLGRERSIVADMPGTTRDWVGETADLDGLPIHLIDTPGIRASDDGIEQAAITAAVEKVRQADLVVLVLDATRPLVPDQQPLMNRFPDALRVINKTDCPPAFAPDLVAGLPISATAQQGIGRLISAIHAHFGIANYDLLRPRRF